MNEAIIKLLLAQHKREVAHCGTGYAAAKTSRESRRWLFRLKLHSRTVTVLLDLLGEFQAKVAP